MYIRIKNIKKGNSYFQDLELSINIFIVGSKYIKNT
jgi:hypothetical protein